MKTRTRSLLYIIIVVLLKRTCIRHAIVKIQYKKNPTGGKYCSRIDLKVPFNWHKFQKLCKTFLKWHLVTKILPSTPVLVGHDYYILVAEGEGAAPTSTLIMTDEHLFFSLSLCKTVLHIQDMASYKMCRYLFI